MPRHRMPLLLLPILLLAACGNSRTQVSLSNPAPVAGFAPSEQDSVRFSAELAVGVAGQRMTRPSP